jgi:hypothetical protein
MLLSTPDFLGIQARRGGFARSGQGLSNLSWWYFARPPPRDPSGNDPKARSARSLEGKKMPYFGLMLGLSRR